MPRIGFIIDTVVKNFSSISPEADCIKNSFALSVSFNITPGVIHGLLGPNGAGKSTLMKILGREISPHSGEIKYFYENAPEVIYSFIERPLQVGLLSDAPPFYLHMQVFEYLNFVAQLFGMNSKSAKLRANEIIKKCQLEELSSFLIAHLSTGQRQKLGIAQALINPSDFLILDEPLSALDPESIFYFRDLIKKEAQKKTVILSSHQLYDITQLCDEVTILNKGKVVATGELRLLKEKFHLEELPQTVRFNLDIQDYFKSIELEVGSEFLLMNNLLDLLYKQFDILEHQIRIKENRECEMAITFRGGSETKKNISKFFVNKGIDLLSLSEQELDLEIVFREATKDKGLPSPEGIV